MAMSKDPNESASMGHPSPSSNILAGQQQMCSLWVKGECKEGHDCPHRHQRPTDPENRPSNQKLKDDFFVNNDPIGGKLRETGTDISRPLPPEDKTITTLYVGNVNDSINEKELRDHFSKFGQLRKLDLNPIEHCAIVGFVNREDAELAVAKSYQQSVINGHELIIKWENCALKNDAATDSRPPKPVHVSGVQCVSNGSTKMPRLIVIFLNECEIIAEFQTNRDKKYNLNHDLLSEFVFGSVALKTDGDVSITKIHELNKEQIMTSLIFNHTIKKPETGLNQRKSNVLVPRKPSDSTLITRRFAISIIWDVAANPFIRELLFRQSHLIDCFMFKMKDEFTKSLKAKSSILIEDSMKCFINEIENILSAEVLSTDVTIENFIDIFAQLINELDTKQTNFFLSTLISAILTQKNQPEEWQLVLTCSSLKQKPVLSKLLLILNYFYKDTTLWSKSFDSPQTNLITLSSTTSVSSTHKKSDRCESTTSLSSTQLENNPSILKSFETSHSINTPIPRIQKKSRDETLGYGSLGDSGAFTDIHFFDNPSIVSSDCVDSSARSDISISSTPIVSPKDLSALEQSKLYMKEYQNLRFNPSQCHPCPCSSSSSSTSAPLESPPRHTSPNGRKITSESAASSGFGDDEDIDNYDLGHEIFDSAELPGFGEMSMPKLKTISEEFVANDLTESAILFNKYARHFKLQGFAIKPHLLNINKIVDAVNCSCSYSAKTKYIVHGDCTNWKVNLIEVKSKESVPAMMSTHIGELCESLAIFKSIGMNQNFILGYISSKLTELQLKRHIIETLGINSQTKFNRPSSAQSDHSNLSQSVGCLIDSFSSNLESRLSFLSLSQPTLLGFDSSDVPLISPSIEDQRHQQEYSHHRTDHMHNYCSLPVIRTKWLKIAETSL